MLVLGIESSCDETGLALVDENGLRGKVISTQIDLHALFGGVVPELASREHSKMLPLLFDKLLLDTEINIKDIKAIAVANGPGLLGSLLVGVGFAKALALALDIPIIGVNHLHAHLAVLGLEQDIPFPALGLLVSGGHTHIYDIEDYQSYHVLGRTLDDAAGEACDKFAKMLALPYPGGALVDMLGQQGVVDPKLFPRPYTKNDNLDFSFSGLKTAASLFLQQNPEAVLPALAQSDQISSREAHKERIRKAPQILSNAAASYLFAIADTLSIKLQRAIPACRKEPQSLILAGGVAANSFVRKSIADFAAKNNLALLQAPLNLCTDNGEMIAYLGRQLLISGVKSELDFPAYPRGSKIINNS